ncbi:hypothetical protein HDU96_009309 [Phlyctochytrium bullatum]|nr:hypothetical protein HDU96_009309 [Phlyctochytrium bullatum]
MSDDAPPTATASEPLLTSFADAPSSPPPPYDITAPDAQPTGTVPPSPQGHPPPHPLLVLPPVLIHVFSFALCVLPLQSYLLAKACQEIGVSDSDAGDDMATSWASRMVIGASEPPPTYPDIPSPACRASKPASALAARWMLVYTSSALIPAVLSTLAVGHLGDRVGRRAVLMLAACALWVNLLGRTLETDALSSSSQSMILGMQSYLSDTASPRHRTQFFALGDALVVAFGFLAPLLGSVAATIWGPAFVFRSALACQTCALVYVLTLVPESLASVRRRGSGRGMLIAAWWKRSGGDRAEATPLLASPSAEAPPETGSKSLLAATRQQLAEAMASLTRLARSPSLLPFAIYLFLSDLITAGLANYVVLFFTLRFGWTTEDVGIYLVAVAVFRVFYLGAVLPGLVALFQRRRRAGSEGSEGATGLSRDRFAFDLWMVRIAVVLYSLGYGGIGIAPEGWMLYPISFLYGFAYTGHPNARSILSRCVPTHQQGRLFAGLNVMGAVAGALGSFFFGVIYSSTAETYPPTMMLTMSAVALIALAVLASVRASELARIAAEVHAEASEGAQPQEAEEVVVGHV